MGRITDEAALRAIYGQKGGRSVEKEITTLDQHCRDFIAASPFVILSTYGRDGVDVTPRGDPAGFVQVEDDTHLLIPDRPGNKRLDNLSNLLCNPEIGLIFMIPTVHETLRIRGRAEIRDDVDLCARCGHAGKPALTVLRVEVTCAYLHCAKAFMRSDLWTPTCWPVARPVPPMGVMIADHVGQVAEPETQEQMLARYKQTLY